MKVSISALTNTCDDHHLADEELEIGVS